MQKDFEADNIRLGARCSILQEANIRLRKENADLRQEIAKLKAEEIPRVCVACEKVFTGTRTTRYCARCRKKMRAEMARNNKLYKIGHQAKWMKKESANGERNV